MFEHCHQRVLAHAVNIVIITGQRRSLPMRRSRAARIADRPFRVAGAHIGASGDRVFVSRRQPIDGFREAREDGSFGLLRDAPEFDHASLQLRLPPLR